MNGKFQSILMRNNKQLREDRGLLISKNAEKSYRRRVEDLSDALEQLIVDRDQLLDVNPGNTQTIINPSDFNQDEFVSKHVEIGLKIREIQIKLEVAKKGYEDLFGTIKNDE